MTSWALFSCLLTLSLLMWLFVILALWKEYRFATRLFDLLPVYPIINIAAFVCFSLDMVFSFKEPIYYSFAIVSALILTSSLMVPLIRWINGYRKTAYIKLLQKLTEEKFIVRRFSDYFIDKNIDPKKINVFIRHDADLSLPRIQRIINLEKKFGITSITFFRLHSNKYSFEKAIPVIREMIENGFDIGYHYEVLAITKGDVEKGKEIFSQELEKMREIAPIKFVAAHGDKYKNRQIWSLLDKDKLGIFSAYDMNRDNYISDAGGIDLIAKYKKPLYRLLDDAKEGDVIQILIHADWWF